MNTPVFKWPVLKSYEGEHLSRIAMPLGGIGTGTVSIGGRGQLCDWEVMNRPSKGFSPSNTFFALYAKPEGKQAVTRALEGPLPEFLYEGDRGSKAPNHSLPRFRSCRFDAAYPLAQVHLSDPDVPVNVRIEAFNPLVPGDVDSSSIPLAMLRFVLTNRTGKPMDVAVCGNLQNFIGTDGVHGKPQGNVNRFRKGGAMGWQGIFMHSNGVPAVSEQAGTMALVTNSANVSFRTAWPTKSWGNVLLDFWDDFSSDGQLEQRDGSGQDDPMASLAAMTSLAPRETRSLTFLLTWHFPNRMSWDPPEENQPTLWCGLPGDSRVGNHYARHYKNAWEVVRKTAPDLGDLEHRTQDFVNSFCGSDLPLDVKEAALFNLSTLRSQTCFRIESGEFLGWEGCDDQCGCCFGSCTHVWNYETASSFLFGELARSMRSVAFQHATNKQGLMSFRVHLPLERARKYRLAAADGQSGCLMKLYRDWQLCGDDNWLRSLWPQARKALEFYWIAGGWDGDRDGVMEGCQHNTMDVEYYGPNPQMQFWYLGALRAMEEMAKHLGEMEFSNLCRDLFERGSAWIDTNLFNGYYYEHRIQPPKRVEDVAVGLCNHVRAHTVPNLQLGAGCLVDQLAGQVMAHVCGLGYLARPSNIHKTLQSIMKYNWRENLYGHFNHLRTFALNDESALLMATYPLGRRPQEPFPYYNEVMTGFEYTAAVHMLYEGQVANGLKVIAAIRHRYDGKRRNPFDEAECGHHYARAMASWSAVLALTGFQYDAVAGTLSFAAKPGNHFWSNGDAWGRCVIQKKEPSSWRVSVKILHGCLRVNILQLTTPTTVLQCLCKSPIFQKGRLSTFSRFKATASPAGR